MAIARYSVNRIGVNTGRLLGATHELSANLVATVSASAEITTNISLGSALSAATALAANLAPNTHEMSSALSSGVTVSAPLLTDISMQSALTGQCTMAGDLLSSTELRATLIASNALTDDLTSLILLSSALVSTPMMRARCQFDPDEASYDTIAIRHKAATLNVWTAR